MWLGFPMAFGRTCDLRVLVAIVCGLLSATVLGLGIWMTVVRIHRGKSAAPSNTPTGLCSNGGTWQNGRCICPDLWTGLRCTRANFCENSTYGDFTFDKIAVGRYGPSLQKCGVNTVNAGSPRATRLCTLTENGEIELQNATIGNCSANLQTLEDEIDKIGSNTSDISNEAQVLTSDASKLTPENITSAAKVVGQIFNSSRNANAEAKLVAVTTVSQLLDAKEEVFQRAAAATAAANDFATLTTQLGDYSLSMGNQTVVSPNVAIQSVSAPKGSTAFTSVRFTVQKGTSNSLAPGSTRVDPNVDTLSLDAQTELQIHTSKINARSCGFIVYQNDKLFQSKTFTSKLNVNQKVVSSKTDKEMHKENQDVSVEMAFLPQHNSKELKLHSYACVYWNTITEDWDTKGCYKRNLTNGFLRCHCNHMTNFAVLMSFKKNYKYPESLDILSNIGCALSITGLILTIIFQIVTRKVRKTSVTWVFVSLCTSMLIFNLLFVFGIENKNSKTSDSDTNNMDSENNKIPEESIITTPNPTCTVIAALLHYFLLVTFTWTGLSATQLYFLLLRAMKPLPRRFILFISLIGWGAPAIVVAITVGIIFSQNSTNSQWELEYRQEKICWLAIPESDGIITSPFLWAFIVPVTIILISNIVMFTVIIVKVLWKNNQNLTSTKKNSSLKKILSTLSIAVVFGITWVLAYAMLLDDDNIRVIFSYIFCLFNTTQGLQIFILYTVKTKVFQAEASKVWKSLSSSAGRVKPRPSMTSLRLRLRMYNMLRSFPTLHERFRLLEPYIVTEETTLSESEETRGVSRQ